MILSVGGRRAAAHLAAGVLLALAMASGVAHAVSDDPYEPNDFLAAAWDFSAGKTQWLSSFGGSLGIANDFDYYRITVSPGSPQLNITATFTHITAFIYSIDMELYNSLGGLVATAWSLTDNENISVNVVAGTYYILVWDFDGPGGNTYDLWWDDGVLTDDIYEENDSLATAWDFSLGEGTLLSVFGSWQGVQMDNDWYKIDVTAGNENVIINCTFTHADGNIDIQLVDIAGAIKTTSISITDNEFIDFVVGVPGTYYIRVYGAVAPLPLGDMGNTYDLWWDGVPPPDDPYEPNNSLAAAWDFSLGEGTLLNIYGTELGVQWNDDWYQIEVTAGFENVVIDCRFTHADGDIDIQLVHSSGVPVASSTSTTDNESISAIVAIGGGTYYIRVYGDNTGNTYDLWWDDADDRYEENDFLVDAWDFSSGEMVWLSNYGGSLGIADDDDWYMISVAAGFTRLDINCTFIDANGGIDMELYDAAGTLIDSSVSSTDNESISFDVGAAGTYYVKVFSSSGTGNTYDLWWDDAFVPTPGSDDPYESNNSMLAAWDFSMGEGTWLNTYGTELGVQWNADWYEIVVAPGYENVVIDCTFTHVAGDINIELIDSIGVVVALSNSATDDENIDFIVAGSGTYYIRVYGGNTGNSYDLWWDDADDRYEPNDTLATAWDFSPGELMWLSTYGGALGVQVDDDWYQIDVAPEKNNVVIDLTFTHTDGNIDIELFGLIDSAYVVVAWSTSTNNNEYLDFEVVGPGTYYIRVYGSTVGDLGNLGNTYDLWWDDRTPDDVYEQNDTRATAWDFSEGEREWLSVYGMTTLGLAEPELGLQLDDDWYQIEVSAGSAYVIIDLTFNHEDGDIDMELVDSAGRFVAGATSITDNESRITSVAGPGTYYIRVYLGNVGNTYDLMWDDGVVDDDPYEQNDTLARAWDFSMGEGEWLSDYGGSLGLSGSTLGMQVDDDWYRIEVTAGDMRVRINFKFTHADGDIDIRLVDSGGLLITESTSSTDTNNSESINTIVPSSGTYYIHVDGANLGNTYDLWWDDVLPNSDDPYEENDNIVDAEDLSGVEGTWLFTSGGWLGVQFDDDWYQIEVTAGYENVVINCTFTHLAGNIDVALVDSAGNTVTMSASTTNNENIDTLVAGPGTYYIVVYGDNVGNTYDLWWDDVVLPPPVTTTTTKDDDCGCSPRQADIPTLGNVFGTILSWLPLMLLLLLRNRHRKGRRAA